MEVVSNIANGFIGLFNAGGETFMGWVTGIIPLVICLMTAVNAVIGFIGVERVEGFCQKITKYTILRYTLLPVMADIFLTNPAQYTFGRFLKKEHKAAFYDASVSNAGELFVYMGIASGLQKAGYSIGGLAVRYFIVGVIVILIRGILCERIYAALSKR